jgi:hypothetical protein
MYIHALADGVTLYLQYDFYNVTFKIKHKLYTASGSAPPPLQRKILGAHLCHIHKSNIFNSGFHHIPRAKVASSAEICSRGGER